MEMGETENCERLILETNEPFDQLLSPGYRFLGAYGGRGSGKSHFFAERLVEECYSVPGTRAVCIREIQKSLSESSKLLIEDKIRVMGLQKHFIIRDAFIVAPGGGLIIFQGMQNHTAESIKSLEGFRIAWVDEAHKLSAVSLGLLRPTLFRVPNSQLWFSWNPKTKKDPVDVLFRGDNVPDDAISIEVYYDDNPWFPDDLRKEMEHDRRRDPERYRHVWLGEYQVISEAVVFRNWKVQEFASPEDEYDWERLGTKPRFYLGADWGFASAPTVIVRCWMHERTLYVDYEEYGVGVELDATPRMFDRIPQVKDWPIVADSANPQAISYMRRHGFPKIQASVKGARSVEEGVEFLKSYDIVVHPRCVHVADELTKYSYEVDPHTEEVLPELADKHNHTIDALRYALEGFRRQGIKAGWGSY